MNSKANRIWGGDPPVYCNLLSSCDRTSEQKSRCRVVGFAIGPDRLTGSSPTNPRTTLHVSMATSAGSHTDCTRSAERGKRAHTRGSECGQRSSDSPDNNASSSRNTSSDVPEKQNVVDDAVDPARAPNGAYRSFPSMPALADTLSALDIQRPGITEITSASSEKMNIEFMI
jgi:hypothetical protein